MPSLSEPITQQPGTAAAPPAFDGSFQGPLADEALSFLRGEENPFDVFVAGQNSGDDSLRYHVPEIQGAARRQLRLAIEKYRQASYRQRPELHPTRVLVVRGPRGAGKTHLLHTLLEEATFGETAFESGNAGLLPPAGRTSELVVRPRYFEKQYPFAEYLLKELVQSLLFDAEGNFLSGAAAESSAGYLAPVAREVTRRMLLEAVRRLSPPEWLHWTGRAHALGVLAGWSWATARLQQQRLCERLENLPSRETLAAACRGCRLEPATAVALLSAYIARNDSGASPLAQMRRRLLSGLVAFSLGETAEPLVRFLEDGFAESAAGMPPTRAALVDDLLRTLVEVLAAVQVPVVFAFDNLERLLAPLGRLDEQAAQAFFAGLAHLVDSVPGILAVLFAEGGLWSQCATQAIDSFASDRLLQGVRLRQYGNVSLIDLPSPDAEQLEALVARRMAPLLARTPAGDKLPPTFPFQNDDLRRIADPNDVLRRMLQRLRDRFDELVLGRPAGHVNGFTGSLASEPRTARSRIQVEREVLIPRWDQAVQLAGRRLASSPRASLAGELHTGLGKWLAMFAHPDFHLAGWNLLHVETGVTFGNQPNYGVLTVPYWVPAGGSQLPAGGSRGSHPRRVGVGIVLGQGPGVAKDLEVKLSLFSRQPTPADELVVLWPGGGPDFSADSLPAKTRQVWDERRGCHPVGLRGLAVEDLAWLLGFGEWLNAVQEEQGPDWPPDAVAQFVQDRTAGVLQLVLPTDSAQENAP